MFISNIKSQKIKQNSKAHAYRWHSISTLDIVPVSPSARFGTGQFSVSIGSHRTTPRVSKTFCIYNDAMNIHIRMDRRDKGYTKHQHVSYFTFQLLQETVVKPVRLTMRSDKGIHKSIYTRLHLYSLSLISSLS